MKEPEVACSGSWMENEGKCYKVFEAKHSRNNAEEDCAYKGGYLVDIPTSSDQDFIERFLLNGENKNLKADIFWIGKIFINCCAICIREVFREGLENGNEYFPTTRGPSSLVRF